MSGKYNSSEFRKGTPRKAIPCSYTHKIVDRETNLITSETRDYTPEEVAFMKEMEACKRKNRRPFPTWHEVLKWAKEFGYKKE